MTFRILIRAFNAEKYIKKCLNSIIDQTVQNWTALVWLDGSTDRTMEVIRPYLGEKVRVTISPKRMGVSHAMYNGIADLNEANEYMSSVLDDDDVVCLVDGDDWLPASALRIVEKAYEKHPKALITYGSYVKVSTRKKSKTSKPYASGANVRKAKWHASHLKTIKWGLARRIKEEWFKDNKGRWLQAASDLALMIPLLEIATLKRAVHIPKITYWYRDTAKGRCRRQLQRACEKIVRAKKRVA